jgi:hypothetical protein
LNAFRKDTASNGEIRLLGSKKTARVRILRGPPNGINKRESASLTSDRGRVEKISWQKIPE